MSTRAQAQRAAKQRNNRDAEIRTEPPGVIAKTPLSSSNTCAAAVKQQREAERAAATVTKRERKLSATHSLPFPQA